MLWFLGSALSSDWVSYEKGTVVKMSQRIAHKDREDILKVSIEYIHNFSSDGTIPESKNAPLPRGEQKRISDLLVVCFR